MLQTDPDLLKYRFYCKPTPRSQSSFVGRTLNSPGSLDKGGGITLPSSDLSGWDLETKLWLSCLKRENRQYASFSGWVSQGSQCLRTKNSLLGWLGLSPTLMKTWIEQPPPHHALYMPQRSLRAQAPALRPTPNTVPQAAFLHRLLCGNRARTKEKCNTENKPCRRKGSCHRNETLSQIKRCRALPFQYSSLRPPTG